MKRYGAKKSTEFTKKQISCLYGAAKRSEIKIEKWVISNFYDLADYYGYDDNRSVEEAEAKILKIIDNFFSKDVEKTQELIDNYTTDTFELLARKAQKTVDRSYL